MSASAADLEERLAAVAEAVAAELDRLLPPLPGPRRRLGEALRYAALGGGKRLRPFLVAETAGLFAVPPQRALRAGAALEMVHCYSLVHDDLPAMDDSDLRRGRPTVHRAYDDATAVLAGDGLLTEAFAVLADPATHPDAAVRLALVAELAAAAGSHGMVGGQAIDLSAERESLDLAGTEELQALKTGALIRAACRFGGILGGAPEAAVAALDRYGACLGLAFQIVDDLLDAEATAEELGKPVGRDAAQAKATFVGLLGAAGARAKARTVAGEAAAALDLFGPRAEVLRALTDYVLDRRS